MNINPQQLMERMARALGAPVIQPVITENQYLQAIDDAIKLYTEFHYNGSYKDYIIMMATEVNKGDVGIFKLPSNVLAVTKILRHGTGLDMKGITTTDGATDMWFTSMFQGALGGMGLGGNCSVGLSSLQGLLPFYTILEMNIGLWANQMNPETNFVFSSANKTLMLMNAKVTKGYVVICEAVVQSTLGMYEGGDGSRVGGDVISNHVESLPSLYGDKPYHQEWHNSGRQPTYIGQEQSLSQGGLDERWVIEYATAKAKYYWGMNMSYVSGVSQSAGGVKIDSQLLKEEAMVTMNRLKEEVKHMGNQPIMMIG